MFFKTEKSGKILSLQTSEKTLLIFEKHYQLFDFDLYKVKLYILLMKINFYYVSVCGLSSKRLILESKCSGFKFFVV